MSVSENVGSPLTLIAAEDLAIFHFVFIDANGLAAETNAEDDHVIGVTMETVLAGESVPIATNQGARLQVVADGAHTAGDVISAGAAGEIVTEGAAGEISAGIVMEDAAADQDIIAILLQIKRVPA